MNTRAATTTVIAHRNARQESVRFQCVDTSSKQYRMPPIGALKAAHMPAAAPMLTHVRKACGCLSSGKCFMNQ